MFADLLLLALLGAEPSSEIPPISADPPAAEAPPAPQPYLPADPDGDASVRGALMLAVARQGPLDGTWVIAAPEGARLYNLHIVDPPGGPLEGAWRDLTAPPGAAAATGVVSLANREEAQVTISFTAKAGFVTATLRPRAGGGYAGDLAAAGGPARPILMIRP